VTDSATNVAVMSGAYFLCLQGAHDKGTRFLFLTILYCSSGECPPALDDVVEGGVGDMMEAFCAPDPGIRRTKVSQS
jgi:hypothetical protein